MAEGGSGNLSNVYSIFGISQFINGVQSLDFRPLNDLKIVSGFTSPFAINDLVIGDHGEFIVHNRHWNGDIAEIIIYGTQLSTTDRIMVEDYLRSKYTNPVNLGPDFDVSNFCDTIVDAGDCYVDYQWSTGATTQTLTIDQGGTYSVTVSDNFGVTFTDQVTIVGPSISVNDTTICLGQTVTLHTGLSVGYTYLWHDNSTDSTFTTSVEGFVSVTVTDQSGCSAESGPLFVDIDSFSIQASIGPVDTSMCSGYFLGLVTGAGNVISYLWSTGSIAANISVTDSGLYGVTVTSFAGCVASDDIWVDTVGVAPEVNFSSADICLGETSFFNDLTFLPPDAGPVTSWFWDFDDSTTSALQNPIHVYDVEGQYSVALTVTTDSCAVIAVKVVNVSSSPTASFEANISCAGIGTIFTNSSTAATGGFLIGYEWHFGDDSTSLASSPVHIYDSAGIYTVKLVVTSSLFCTDTFKTQVEVFPILEPVFETDHLCVGSVIQFTDATASLSVISWQWNFGDGTTSSLQHPTYMFTVPGTYDITFSVVNAIGCANFIVKEITVVNPPIADFMEDSICVGNPTAFVDLSTSSDPIVSWSWDFGDGNTSNLAAPIHVFNATGSFPVSLNVTTDNSCFDDVTKNIEVVLAPQADFIFSPAFGAAPIEINFSNQSAGVGSYFWQFGSDPGNNSTTVNPSFTFTENGIHLIMLIASSGSNCMDTTYKTIELKETVLDIAATDIDVQQDLQVDGNYVLSVTGDFVNTGTRHIQSFDIDVSLGNEFTTSEMWQGTLLSGQAITVPLSTRFVVGMEEDVTFVCIEAKNPNEDVDAFAGNNKVCAVLENDIKVIAPYPNPGDEQVTIGVILPKKEAFTLSIFNAVGQIVYDMVSEETEKGLNEMELNTSKFSQGAYVIKIDYKDNSHQVKFVIER